MINKTERSKIIFNFIVKYKKLKISEILDFLKEKDIKVDQRTVLRDLNQLIKNNEISKGGRGKNVYYYLSDVNKLLENIDVEKYFDGDYTKRNIQESFNFQIFDILENDIFSENEKIELNQLQKQFISNISKYDSQTLINKEYERIMIEFSWKSSAIEGNTYTLLSTEALIKENIKDDSKTQEETQMILNHKDAFNESIQNKNSFFEIRFGDIEYIHGVLTKGLGVTKNIRKSPVGIVGTKYKPLENEFLIREALEKLVDLVNKKESFFEKAFVVLILLSYIQAFEDGNKRTARMFSNAILIAYNSIPLSYRIVDVIEYKKACILFYEINNISYFKKIFIEQFTDAVDNYFN